MWDLVIRNGLIVNPDRISTGTIAVKEGKIAAIFDKSEATRGKHEINAEGLYVFPGFIDCHVHLNDPGFTWREDYLHGTSAAARGGITTVIDMPMQNEPAMTNKQIMGDKEHAVGAKAIVDYCFWGGVKSDTIEQVEELDAAGVVGFKCFLGPISPDYSSLSQTFKFTRTPSELYRNHEDSILVCHKSIPIGSE